MTDVLITAGELADLITKEPCVIIDTRNPDAYGAGHIPNAVNVHEIFTYLATSTPEGMSELETKFADAFGAAGLSGKETAVIYEQSMNSGFGQSCRGYYLLTMLGYPKIKVVHGGFDAWAAAGLPATKDVASPVNASFSIVPEASEILIDAKTMLSAVGKPGIALLDVRDVDEWAAVQVQGRDSRRMRHRRHQREHAGLSLLLQGRAGVEHVPGAEERGREGCADVFRLLERMVA